MADNYLEKRYDEVFNNPRPKVKRIGHTVDDLMLRNRSYRGYHKPFVVTSDMLERIVSVNTRIPSARNQQVLRFRLVTRDDGASGVLGCIRMGASLPEMHLPLPGTEPEAFVVVCSQAAESRNLFIDLGISLQSMLLKAVEMGLGGLIIQAFDRDLLTRQLQLPMTPLAVLAIGKPAEKIELVPISDGQSQTYYRKDGTHYVPKLTLSSLLI